MPNAKNDKCQECQRQNLHAVGLGTGTCFAILFFSPVNGAEGRSLNKYGYRVPKLFHNCIRDFVKNFYYFPNTPRPERIAIPLGKSSPEWGWGRIAGR